MKRCGKRTELTLGKRKLSMENKNLWRIINVDSFPSCLHHFFPPHLPVWSEVADGPWLLQADSGLEIPSDQNKNHIVCCILNRTADTGVNCSLQPVSYYQHSDTCFAAFHCSEHPENHQPIYWTEAWKQLKSRNKPYFLALLKNNTVAKGVLPACIWVPPKWPVGYTYVLASFWQRIKPASWEKKTSPSYQNTRLPNSYPSQTEIPEPLIYYEASWRKLLWFSSSKCHNLRIWRKCRGYQRQSVRSFPFVLLGSSHPWKTLCLASQKSPEVLHQTP